MSIPHRDTAVIDDSNHSSVEEHVCKAFFTTHEHSLCFANMITLVIVDSVVSFGELFRRERFDCLNVANALVCNGQCGCFLLLVFV